MKSTSLENAPKFELVDGVQMALIGDGENMTLIRILIQPGSIITEHAHPNEQIGACVEGRGILSSGGVAIEAKPGVSWVIPANEPHKFEALGEAHVLIFEAWSPPREDYRKKAKIKE